jgi:integrase/recombinase XerD
MNLHTLVEQFIAFRQALGERFATNAATLQAFSRAVGEEIDATAVTPEQVSAFLTGTGPLTRAWHGRYSALRSLYGYALSRGYVTASPLPVVVPKPPPPFIPYIYKPEELGRLVRAADSYQRRPSGLEPLTMRTAVLLLYGTALRVREVLALDRADVDLGNNLLTVHQTKFFKTRLVPFGPQLGQSLAHYLARPQASALAAGPDAPFFTMRTGGRVKQVTIESSFRRLRRHAGIQRLDGARYQPRLHDLRHNADCRIMPTRFASVTRGPVNREVSSLPEAA